MNRRPGGQRWIRRHALRGTLLLALLSFTAVADCRAGEIRSRTSSETPDSPESVASFLLAAGVRITIQAPAPAAFDPARRTLPILYALPNGNTTEQTAGRTLREGDDWHYDIQHIRAQTRFLRQAVQDANIVTAYLEAEGKSWPSWRRQRRESGREIVGIVDSLRARFRGLNPGVVLSGHSGGGSFIFGYIGGVEEVPEEIVRIAWLDATYAYEDSLHAGKLLRWIRARGDHSLTVCAYNDSIALLNGKPFVSATGGTWHRSRLMLERLGRELHFTHTVSGATRVARALGGRIQFLLTENPDRTILHTVLVERNGFIHSLLAGTPQEESGYRYLGARAYGEWIDSMDISVTQSSPAPGQDPPGYPHR